VKCKMAILTSLVVLAIGCSTTSQTKYSSVYGSGSRELVVATGSPGELGLLKVLGEQFADKADAKVLWYNAGSGRSLELLRGKEADVVMVHAPQAEQNAVGQGWAVRRTLIGSNEFYIVGPADDPSEVRLAGTAAQAYAKIAAKGAKFLSRADNSGTHKREMAIWRQAGIDPQGPWYIPTHDFMTAPFPDGDRAFSRHTRLSVQRTGSTVLPPMQVKSLTKSLSLPGVARVLETIRSSSARRRIAMQNPIFSRMP